MLVPITETYTQAIAGKKYLKVEEKVFKLRDIAPEVTFYDYRGGIIDPSAITLTVSSSINCDNTHKKRKWYILPKLRLHILPFGKTKK